jgi:hypothetical protein
MEVLALVLEALAAAEHERERRERVAAARSGE